jgi:hypothetical protein
MGGPASIALCSKLKIEQGSSHWKVLGQQNISVHPKKGIDQKTTQEIKRKKSDILLNQNASCFYKIVE